MFIMDWFILYINKRRVMEGKNDVILGLDISTQCIGFCLLEDDGSKYGKIIELTHINPKVPSKTDENEKLFLKKRVFEEFIMKYKDFGINYVVIESPLLRSNNVNTVSTLLRFNGMVSDCVYNMLGVVPQYISSYDARKYSFPELMSIRKYGKDEKQYSYSKIEKEIKECKLVLFGGYPWTIDKKTVVQGKVSEIFPDIEWIYDKKGELKKENFDACDAYVALLGWLNKRNNGELEFSVKVTGDSNDGKGNHEIHYDVSYWNVVENRITYVSATNK